MSVPNYLLMIQRLFALGAIAPAALTFAVFEHDDWCAIHRGESCDCHPNARLNGRVYRYSDVMGMN